MKASKCLHKRESESESESVSGIGIYLRKRQMSVSHIFKAFIEESPYLWNMTKNNKDFSEFNKPVHSIPTTVDPGNPFVFRRFFVPIGDAG